MTVRVDALNRQADNSLSVKMEIVPIPLAMAQDMAGAVKKFFLGDVKLGHSDRSKADTCQTTG